MNLFPFEKIEKGKNIIIYGAADVGMDFLTQLRKTGYCNVVCMLDKAVKIIPEFSSIAILPPEYVVNKNYDCILLATQLENTADDMRDTLTKMGVKEEKIIFSKDRNIAGGDTKYIVPGYSEDGDDKLVLSLFKVLGIINPSYIDLGASHPYKISNTALLYRNGSRGINVDANPNLIKAFYTCRPEDININVGISTEEGVIPFFMFDWYGKSSFIPAQAEAFLQKNPKAKLTVADIPVRTVKSIVDEYLDGKWPNYMDIDIEGLDFEVLASLDLADGPTAITAEILGFDIKAFNEMMYAKGYVPYARTRINITYVKKDIPELLFT